MKRKREQDRDRETDRQIDRERQTKREKKARNIPPLQKFPRMFVLTNEKKLCLLDLKPIVI